MASLSHFDKGKIIEIKNSKMTVNGHHEIVHWGNAAKPARHGDCKGRLVFVEEKIRGQVRLDSGCEFQNPTRHVEKLTDHEEGQLKEGVARVLKIQQKAVVVTSRVTKNELHVKMSFTRLVAKKGESAMEMAHTLQKQIFEHHFDPIPEFKIVKLYAEQDFRCGVAPNAPVLAVGSVPPARTIAAHNIA